MLTVDRWPSLEARCNGVALDLSLGSIIALASINNWTTLSWPLEAAHPSGVHSIVFLYVVL